MIPAFDPQTASLPAGIHEVTWAEVAERFGGTPRRDYLLNGMRWALQALAAAGCTRLYLGGSFVSARPEAEGRDPGDWDVAWEQAGVTIEALHPALKEFDVERFIQKRTFYGEAFPADWVADTQGTLYREFFQRHKLTGQAVGVVALDPHTVR